MRVAANEAAAYTNSRIRAAFGWSPDEGVEWRSPIRSDAYAEYYDEEFLAVLGLEDLAVPLRDFWPRSGPRWDALARTSTGKVLLVEAKAYIEEAVDFGSRARPESLAKIRKALEETKAAFGASARTNWLAPLYQYANRLAHLHFLVTKNGADAYLAFIYFANAPDVPSPCSAEQWDGARRLSEKCLGLGRHPYRGRIATVVVDVPTMLSNTELQATTRKRRR